MNDLLHSRWLPPTLFGLVWFGTASIHFWRRWKNRDKTTVSEVLIELICVIVVGLTLMSFFIPTVHPTITKDDNLTERIANKPSGGDVQ